MKLPKRHDDAEARREQALTPMIDLVFLLLTFWICASVGRVSEQVLPTALSGAGVAADAPPPADDPPELGELWVRLERRGERTAATINGVTHPDLSAVEAIFAGVAGAGAAGEVPVILGCRRGGPGGGRGAGVRRGGRGGVC